MAVVDCLDLDLLDVIDFSLGMGASTSCSKRMSSSQNGVESNEDDSMSSSRLACLDASAVASNISANRSITSARSFHWTLRKRVCRKGGGSVASTVESQARPSSQQCSSFVYPSLYNFDVATFLLGLVRKVRCLFLMCLVKSDSLE